MLTNQEIFNAGMALMSIAMACDDSTIERVSPHLTTLEKIIGKAFDQEKEYKSFDVDQHSFETVTNRENIIKDYFDRVNCYGVDLDDIFRDGFNAGVMYMLRKQHQRGGDPHDGE